jgi:hypothetical protein
MKRSRRTCTTRHLLGAESLERRQMLAVDSVWQTALIAPAPVVAPSAAIAPAVPPAIPVAVVPAVDPLYGYSFALKTPKPASGFDFATLGGQTIASVDVGLVDVPLGATLDLETLSGLQFWNGRGQPAFAAVKGGVEINLRATGANLRVGAKTDQPAGQVPGSVRHSLEVAVSDGLPVSRRITATIGVGGVGESFAKPGAPSGVYAFTGLWSVRNAVGIRDSAPVTLVFAAGGVSRQARDAAVAAFSTPAKRPVAIVAVATQLVSPDGPGQQFLQINVQYSAPVTVTGRSPQLPVFFDRSMRLVELERGSARTGVTTLSFALVPTAQERAASSVRLGDALRLQSGGALRAAAGGPSILSLPPEAARQRVIGFEAPILIVTADIARSTTFRRGTTYVIDGEVHVRPGVTLTIEDGVTVLIRNGYRPKRTIDTSALVFDSGSKLKAATVTFGAADSQNRQTSEANNGGVFFLGTFRSCTKDGISVDTRAATGRSSFTADLINLTSLGRTDPLGGDGDDNDRDDIDAISLLGLAPTEWRVKAVRSDHSGDDGFDVTNSSISLDRLTVVNPVEDGLNITSSTVQIRQALTVAMSPSIAPDRELFDLEVDDGAAKVVIDRLAAVDLRGYWGNAYDEVNLNSLDMPAPPRRGTAGQWYVFNGVLRRGPAIVYSTIAD